MSTKRRQFHFWHLLCKIHSIIDLFLNFRYFYDIFDDNSKIYINNILIASTISLIPLMQSQTETLLSMLLSVLQIIIFGQRDTNISIFQVFLIIVYFCLKTLFNSKDFMPLLIISFSSGLIILTNSIKLYFSETFPINKK